MDKVQSERQLRDILSSPSAFTSDDLAVLRQKAVMLNTLTGNQESPVTARLEVELIDTIQRLDATSTRLINRTNNLTQKILWLTVVGVVLALVGAGVALAPLFHR